MLVVELVLLRRDLLPKLLLAGLEKSMKHLLMLPCNNYLRFFYLVALLPDVLVEVVEEVGPVGRPQESAPVGNTQHTYYGYCRELPQNCRKLQKLP